MTHRVSVTFVTGVRARVRPPLHRGHRGVGIPFLNVDSQADQTSALSQNRRGGGSADVKNEWRWKQNEGKNFDPRIAMIMGHLSWRNFQFQLFEKLSHVWDLSAVS